VRWNWVRCELAGGNWADKAKVMVDPRETLSSKITPDVWKACVVPYLDAVDQAAVHDTLELSHAESAAQSGHWDLLKWLHIQRGGPANNPKVCAYAATHGNSQIMEWLRDRGWPWDVSTTMMAIESGQDHMAAWVITKGCPMPYQVSLLAARHNCPYTLRWLKHYEVTIDSNVYKEALLYKRPRVIRWALDAEITLPAFLCDTAALMGRLSYLKLLYREGCPTSRMIYIGTAKQGQREVFQWLLEANIPWSDNTPCDPSTGKPSFDECARYVFTH